MPELPEVQTTVDGLKKTVIGLTFRDVWTDLAIGEFTSPHLSQSLKDKKFFAKFKKEIIGKKIIDAKRRAKNILIYLSGGKVILIHMKMTGHLMFGEYSKHEITNGKLRITNWAPSKKEKNQALWDPYNKFLHVVFTLSNGKHLVLSDARKFAKVTLLDVSDMDTSIHLGHFGPEPLEKSFTLPQFIARLKKKPNGKIKEVLMDQSIIAGIGNIYSDEMLWLTGIHPEERVKNIPGAKLRVLYTNMKAVLKKGIDFGGDSTSDYRDIDGKRGKFSAHHNAYQRTDKSCGKPRCKGVILRKIVGGRSAHYCSVHQRLLK